VRGEDIGGSVLIGVAGGFTPTCVRKTH